MKYSVVTFLFGNYDKLRDPLRIDKNAEYICLTDRKDLKSNIWKFKRVKFPNFKDYTPWQKSLIARYEALKYISTSFCIKVDASVHIKESFSTILYKYYDCDGVYLIHPWREYYLDEFDEWIKNRSLDPVQKEQFIKYCDKNGYDLNKRGFIMTTVMMQKNNDYNRMLNEYVLNELMNNFDFNIRVDQVYFSIIFLNKFYDDTHRYRFLSMQCLSDCTYFDYYYHNEDYTHNGEYKFDKNIIERKFINDKEVICDYLIKNPMLFR